MDTQLVNSCDRHLTGLGNIEQQLLTCTDIQNCWDTVLSFLGEVSDISYSCIIEVQYHSDQNVICWLAEWYFDRVNDRLKSETSCDRQTIFHEEIAAYCHALQASKAHTQAPIDHSAVSWQPIQLETLGISLLPILVNGTLYGVIGIQQCNVAPHQMAIDFALFQRTAAALSLRLESLLAQVTIQDLAQQVQHLNHQLNTVAQQFTLQSQQTLNFEALLRRITDRVRDSLDEDQILQTAVQELAIVLQTHSCDTGIYNLEQEISTIAYEYVCTSEISSAKGRVLHFADYPTIYSQLLKGQYAQFCWTSSPSSWELPPETTSREIQEQVSILCCPLIDDQGVIGDIWLYGASDRGFGEEAVRLVEQVANQCAIAIRQARLYQAAQAQVRELEHLNYLKDDFLNTVSHELRSPMANIEMAIQMLQLLLFSEQTEPIKQETSETTTFCNSCFSHPHPLSLSDLSEPTLVQQVLRYFRMLQDECAKEINLINDLLDLSRLEAGTEPLMLTPIDLHTWIPHVVEPFLERARTQRQHLRVEVAADVPPLLTDRTSLERILSELLHNACKYTPPEEFIIASAHLSVPSQPSLSSASLPSSLSRNRFSPAPLAHTSPTLLLQISNSGIELPTTELPRIFDKFYRIPSNDPWKYGGTGLGLALVKRLVDHLGAEISVESINRAVIFTIAFPLH